METENEVVAVNGGSMTASAESESTRSDGLLSQDQQELCERVAHLEKRVREQEDEIVCLKGALADVLRRIGQVESIRTQNSLLPSKPFVKTPRKAPLGQERPKSTYYESSTPRPSSQQSARQRPRGSSSSSMNKKWSSMEKNIEGTNGHSSPRHNTSQLTHSKRSSSHGNLPLKLSVAATTKGGIKEPTYDPEDKYVRMHLKGRPVLLYAPNDLEDYDVKAPQNPPDAELKLEWVYGYRGRDARNNLYNLSGEAIYFSGEVIVLHNFEQNSQRHYLGHTDDVKCLAIHPDQMKVASGQVAGHEKKEGKNSRQKPHVRVWDSVSLNTYYTIGLGEKPDFARGVSCVGFSKMDGGKRLLAVDEGNDHTLSVWDTSRDDRAKKLIETKASENIVTQCEFHPCIDNQIICCGKNQITFWTYDGNSLNKKAGIFEGKEKPKVIICFAFSDNGDVVTGDSSGNIYIWGKGTNRISHAIPNAHKDGVFSLCVNNDGYMLSGGKDRKICLWDSNFEKKEQECEIPERYGAVRMISHGQGNMLLVGTIRNCILQGTMDFEFSPVVEGHKEELWGLAAKPELQQFLTCGSDRHIYCWDSQAHACVWMKEVADPAHCICIHPKGDIAAIGCQGVKGGKGGEVGRWFAMDLSNHEIIAVFEDGKEQIECISFSPDGSMLAAGCRDNNIYIYNVEEDGRKFHKLPGKCSGHSSYVTHIDWSENGEVIRSNSGDYEVLYWTAKRCKQETNKDDVRDLVWATQNCTLSFNSIGVWPDGADGTDVNNCAKSNDGTVIASADDFGKVNLLSYPSIQPRATGHAYGGHSSHVTNVCFLVDDTHVISTGGRDTTVLQFQVVRC